MQVSFKGIIPPYKISKAKIYPIEKDISSSDINDICNAVLRTKSFGEGVNGRAYHYGQDLVIKKSKTDALTHTDLMNEAKKLDMLYELRNERGKNLNLSNTQRGIAAFTLNNGESYLISSLVKGSKADPYNNPLNHKNLSSLIATITDLDKGSDKYGRMMVYDLNINNIYFTKDKAGILDFEHLKGENIDESIKKIVIEKDYGSAAHTSDTSYLNSNLRSFEIAALHDYLLEAKDAKTKFIEYLKQKSYYHKKMSTHLLKQSEVSIYPDIVKEIAEAEKAHANVLSKNRLPEDIIKSEAMKIQMANFMFISSRSCNSVHTTFNPRQLIEYRRDGLKYFEENLLLAEKAKDKDKIIYYNNCIDLFNKWKKIENLQETMNDSQRGRVSRVKLNTLDKIIFA